MRHKRVALTARVTGGVLPYVVLTSPTCTSPCCRHMGRPPAKGSVMMTTRVVVGLFVLLSVPVHAGQELTLALSPNVALAPATVRIQAHFDRNPANRAVQIIADSNDFYRSSE